MTDYLANAYPMIAGKLRKRPFASLPTPVSRHEINLPTSDAIKTIAFLALLVGSFTKAGAFPFHTWIPDYSENAPATSSAYLPASLDKADEVFMRQLSLPF